MEFEESADFLDKASGAVAVDEEAFEMDTTGYISGKDLLDINAPNESKTSYYIEQASKRGTKEKLKNYLEPIGFRITDSRTKSRMFGTKATMDMFVIDLSVLQLLVQGKSMGKITGDHKYEIFAMGDSKLKKETMEGLRELFK